MEVQGAGTCRHVARKQEFSWGNGASHRVLEMVPIKLGWFQRFLRTRFLRTQLLSLPPYFTVYKPMEVPGAGTCRHVARKREFSWGNGASHRVLEMVPIKLGWFQRFLRTRFLRKKLLSFSARPIISQWEDPKHGVTLLHVTGPYEISRIFVS